MSKEICIVSIGAATSVGLNAKATAAAVRADISSFTDHPYMINQEGDPYVVAMSPLVDENCLGADRFIDLSLPALEESLNILSQISSIKLDIPVIVGLPEKRPGIPEELTEKLRRSIQNLSSPTISISRVETVEKGHSAGLLALEMGRDLVLGKTCEFCLTGGVDSYLDPDTLDWVEDNEQLHTPSNAWGFVPGEAAAFCLLCSADTAQKYKIPVRAKLVSISSALEKNRIKTETVCIGEGLTQAVRGAVSGLPEVVKIDYTICDQNGEAYRADEYGFMLCRLAKSFSDPSDYLAPADCWGDVGAASGPLFLCLVVAAAEKGYDKGPYSLLWTSSEGGDRCAALIRTLVERQRTV